MPTMESCSRPRWYEWRRQIPALVEAGFRVVAPDQRGFGLTDRPNAVEAYDMSQAVDDFVGLMSALGESSAVGRSASCE